MHIVWAKLGQAIAGDNDVKMMKPASEWVRTNSLIPFTVYLARPLRHHNCYTLTVDLYVYQLGTNTQL